jgi:hypothetical protein
MSSFVKGEDRTSYDKTFLVLPRLGEDISFSTKGRQERFRVTKVLHVSGTVLDGMNVAPVVSLWVAR